MVTDDNYLIKMKTAQKPDAVIAAKMGITVEEVNRRWDRILADLKLCQENGYNALCDQFTMMANQYQLLGGSLKIMAGVIGSVINSDELDKLVTNNAEETLKNLRAHCIILRKFVPMTSEEAVRQVIAEN